MEVLARPALADEEVGEVFGPLTADDKDHGSPVACAQLVTEQLMRARKLLASVGRENFEMQVGALGRADEGDECEPELVQEVLADVV